MKTYLVYLGSYEQFKYTYEVKNLKELRKKLGEQYPQFTGRWYKRPTDGCPTGSKRYVVKGWSHGFFVTSKLLIIPDK